MKDCVLWVIRCWLVIDMALVRWMSYDELLCKLCLGLSSNFRHYSQILAQKLLLFTDSFLHSFFLSQSVSVSSSLSGLLTK